MGGEHCLSESRAEGVRGGSLCLEGEAWDQGSAYQVAGSGSGSGRSWGLRVTIPVHSMETEVVSPLSAQCSAVISHQPVKSS